MTKPKQTILICSVLLVVAVCAGLQWGGSSINLLSIVRQITGQQMSAADLLDSDIFFAIRFPRVLTAIACGALLAGAGVLSQTIFANPLASPSIIGTTSGGIAAVTATAYFANYAGFDHQWYWPVAAIIGCVIATSLLLFLRGSTAHGLLLYGLALGAIFAALTGLFMALATASTAHLASILHWLLGGMHQGSWSEVLLIYGLLVALVTFTYRILPQCELLVLGKDVAHSLGVKPDRLLYCAVILIAGFEGVSLSLCGAMTFVGLIVPHISRTVIGPQIKPLFICSMINGATLVVVADTCARTLRSPAELPLGVVLALIGAPFFLLQLRSIHRSAKGEL